MNTSEPASRLSSELNDLYARHGRYLAAWLAAFPQADVMSAPEPEELVGLYLDRVHLQHENVRLRDLLARRQALLDSEAVQAALWVRSWPLFRWPPAARAMGTLAQVGRLLMGRPARAVAP